MARDASIGIGDTAWDPDAVFGQVLEPGQSTEVLAREQEAGGPSPDTVTAEQGTANPPGVAHSGASSHLTSVRPPWVRRSTEPAHPAA